MPPRKRAKAAEEASGGEPEKAAAGATAGGGEAATGKEPVKEKPLEPLEIERSRLLTRDTVFLGRSTKKALLKFQAFYNVVRDFEPEEVEASPKIQQLSQQCLRELKLLAIEVNKAKLTDRAFRTELEECAAAEKEVFEKIEASKANLGVAHGG